MKIALAGDVMIGRAVDEKLNEEDPAYIWGDVLPLLLSSDIRLINLETALTISKDKIRKVFNFKSAPDHVQALKAAEIDVVSLANNHVLDYGPDGLLETLDTLHDAQIQYVGAGRNLGEARKPVILERDGLKLGILGCTDNEPGWAASEDYLGTHYIQVGDIEAIGADIEALRPQVDILILTMHWGPNMRQIPESHFVHFAEAAIEWGVDIFHGHSAHVFQGVQKYKGKLIIFDSGDFIDDYAVDPYLRNDRSFLFLVEVDKEGLVELQLYPTLIDDCQVKLAQDANFAAAVKTMQRLSGNFDTELEARDFGLSLPFR